MGQLIRLRFAARRGARHWLESQLIQRWSLGHLSHVDIMMPDGQLLGARADGVRLRSEGYAQFRNLVRAEIPATEEQCALFYDFVTAQLGKPYDNLALFGFILNRDWQRDECWTCSELPAQGLITAGVLRPLYLPASRITPVMLAAVVSAIPGTQMLQEARTAR